MCSIRIKRVGAIPKIEGGEAEGRIIGTGEVAREKEHEAVARVHRAGAVV